MRTTLIYLLATPLLVACNQTAGVPSEADISAARGKALFAENCVACHGATGQGGLGPDLTGLSIRVGGTFPERHVMATIDGLDRHDDPDAVMPEFGARGLGDTVVVAHGDLGTPVPADLLALSTYLETIQR